MYQLISRPDQFSGKISRKIIYIIIYSQETECLVFTPDGDATHLLPLPKTTFGDAPLRVLEYSVKVRCSGAACAGIVCAVNRPESAQWNAQRACANGPLRRLHLRILYVGSIPPVHLVKIYERSFEWGTRDFCWRFYRLSIGNKWERFLEREFRNAGKMDKDIAADFLTISRNA